MKRNTLQRPATLEAVQKLKCHATAEQVYAAIVTQYPTISRGTVYRNLNQLVASGEIRKLAVSGDTNRFDHQCHGYYYARCLKCERFFDVNMAYIADKANAIQDSYGLQFGGHDLVFKRICADCKA